MTECSVQSMKGPLDEVSIRPLGSGYRHIFAWFCTGQCHIQFSCSWKHFGISLTHHASSPLHLRSTKMVPSHVDPPSTLKNMKNWSKFQKHGFVLVYDHIWLPYYILPHLSRYLIYQHVNLLCSNSCLGRLLWRLLGCRLGPDVRWWVRPIPTIFSKSDRWNMLKLW